MYFLIKKFIYNRKNRIVLGALVVILTGIFMVNQAYNPVYNSVKSSLSIVVQQLEAGLSQNANVSDSTQADTLKKSLSLARQQLKAWEAKDYTKYYELGHQNDLATAQASKTNPNSVSADKSVLNNSLDYYKAVKKSGQSFSIAPGYDNTAIGDSAINLSSWMGDIIFLVLIAVLCGDFFGNEFPNEIRLYDLIKQGRRKTLFKYFFTPVLVVFSVIGAIFVIFFLITGFMKGWGSPQYPYGISNFMTTPVYQVGLWGALYLLLILVFVTSLGQLLSLIFKKPYVGSSLLVIIFVGYSMLENLDFMQPLIRWIPLTYLGSGHIMNLSGKLFGNFSLLIGVAYLIVCSLLFYWLSGLLYSKHIYRRA